MDPLHQKLEGEGLKGVVYMVVNHQGALAQRLHPMLAQRLSVNITLHKQDELQPDVWKTLNGQKDDFLIYDRCGRLTHHISLPYSMIGHGHIESAIREAYCNRICGDCTYESTETLEECTNTAAAQPDADVAPAAEEDTRHGHGHHHGHHHGHGHHGDNNGVNPRGHEHSNAQRHQHGHGHQQGSSHQGHDQGGGMSQRQIHLDIGQLQQQHAVQP